MVTLEYDGSKGKSNTNMSDGKAVLKISNCFLFLSDCHQFLFLCATLSFIKGNYLCERTKSPSMWGDGVDMVAYCKQVKS